MIVNSYAQNIRYTAVGRAIPLGEAVTATVQADPLGNAWGTAVFTLYRGNRPDGPFYALETPITIGAAGITTVFDVSGYGFLRVDVTTPENGAADELVQITVCAKVGS